MKIAVHSHGMGLYLNIEALYASNYAFILYGKPPFIPQIIIEITLRSPIALFLLSAIAVHFNIPIKTIQMKNL